MLRSILIIVAVAAFQATPAVAADRTIVVLGDSLSSGYGIAADESWVALLAEHLKEKAYGYRVVNASIPGDTSTGGLARLPDLIERHTPNIVVIELGGNDGLLGQPVGRLRENLSKMIELVKGFGGQAVLAGIQIPPNYGPAYTQALAKVYPDLARKFHVPLVAFLLQGVALHPELMQADHIHPNAAGQKIVFENVWRVLSKLL